MKDVTVKLLTLKAIGQEYGVSHPTVQQWVADGMKVIRANKRFIRSRREWVDEYLESKVTSTDDDIAALLDS